MTYLIGQSLQLSGIHDSQNVTPGLSTHIGNWNPYAHAMQEFMNAFRSWKLGKQTMEGEEGQKQVGEITIVLILSMFDILFKIERPGFNGGLLRED